MTAHKRKSSLHSRTASDKAEQQETAPSRAAGEQDASASTSNPGTNAAANTGAPDSSSLSTPSTAGASVNDMDDFLARAHALGLKLSREDYERARAGVSAFLRAKRISSPQTNSSDGASGSRAIPRASSPDESSKASATLTNSAGRVKEREPSNSSGRFIPAARPSTSSHQTPAQASASSKQSMLSFFTAVEVDQDPAAKSRPRLDDFSTLEERRRRKERRRRLREKAEREANDADCETGSHRCRKAASEPCEDSPSTCLGADDTPILRPSFSLAHGNFSVNDLSPIALLSQPARRKSISLSEEALARIGLGISPQASSVRLEDADPVADVSSIETPAQRSPNLSKLMKKAHIDATGRLILLPSPTKEAEKAMSDVELILQSATQSYKGSSALAPFDVEVEDELVTANAGGETDDSGVCLTSESVASASKKPSAKGRGMDDSPDSYLPRHRRQASSLDFATNDLNEDIDKLSFLDRVMAQKKSPLRLRREAKARERQARLTAANNDLVVMTAVASSVPMPHSTVPSVSFPTSSSSSSSSSMLASIDQDTALEQSKSVRWASDLKSPRKRMTTKEIYDYEFYGIPPYQFSARPSTLQHWDGGDMDAVARRAAGDLGEDPNGNHFRSRSNFSSTSFGSPVAVRSATNNSLVPNSPGLLSMSLQDALLSSSNGSTSHFPAKRGLLFGANDHANNGNSITTPPILSSSLDGALGDLTNIFSQGPTLARSPARKGVVDTETPPRLVRATTLAAPISLGQHILGASATSPEKSALVRAHSFSALDRNQRSQGAGHSLQADALNEADKENMQMLPLSSTPTLSSGGRKVPRGWAHYSPVNKTAATISPAAIFGMLQQQSQPVIEQKASQQRPRQQKKGKDSRLPTKRNGQEGQKERQRARQISNGSSSDVERLFGQSQHSASEAEGDDERDASPISLMHARADGKSDNSTTRRMKKGSLMTAGGHGRSDSLSASSANDGSPLMLDTRTSKAAILVRPSSGNTLAKALDMPKRLDPKARSHVPTSTKWNGQENAMDLDRQSLSSALRSTVNEGNVLLPHSMEWDKPDGSRIVKLVSEELQAALESGALSVEPPPRFYKLPPFWGRSKSKPQSASYAGMIGQAILSSSDGRLSLSEVYNWISSVYPFFERGDRGWQNSIRHNLSLNKSFIKIERDAQIPGKGGWWAIKDGHDERFRDGNYIAPGGAKAIREDALNQKKGNSHERSEAAKSNQKADLAGSATARRKRPEADRSEGNDYTSESGSLVQVEGTSKSARRRPKKVRVSPKSANDEDAAKPVPVKLMLSPSPKHFTTITPSRPYQPGRVIGTSSSEMGSAYASSIMTGMPVLTDASSPPSSPHNSMPPPAGGIRGAASSQSAQKQHLSTPMMGPYGQGGLSFGSVNFASGFSHHNMPASPLAHMRANSNSSNNLGSSVLRSGVNLVNMSGMDSPLRRATVNSPPVSSVRNTVAGESQDDGEPMHIDAQQQSSNRMSGLNKSPIKFMLHSPVRGSPLRPGGPLNQGAQSAQSQSMMSPAGSQLQLALGQQDSQASQQQSGTGGSASLQTYSALTGSSTPITARWGYASPSPSRRMDGLFSPGQTSFATPNVHGHLGASSTGLDDPFDYSGSFQHEFDITSELQFANQGEPSPMKGFDHHSLGGSRGGIAQGLSYGSLAASGLHPAAGASQSSMGGDQSIGSSYSGSLPDRM